MPAGARFGGPQTLAGTFSHLQQSHLPHHSGHQHPSNAAGLPPPSFSNHPGFAHASQPTALNGFSDVNAASGLAPGFGAGGILGGGGTGLASNAAVMGFAHGAALQQQQQARDALRRTGHTGKGQNRSRIREVWASNLAEEMQYLRELVEEYPYISMDTEFPGVVARPMGQFTSRADYHYQTLRANVDLLSVIQLGITLFSKEGETPSPHPENTPFQSGIACPHTWQFNFKFNPDEDMFNQDSLDFLTTVGVNLDLHARQGIDPRDFGSLLITSGLVMFDDVRWISFHSGYDFGYLVKIMHCKPLPEDEIEYRRLLSLYFPSIYDIKFMVKSATKTQIVNGNSPITREAASVLQNLVMKPGLQDLADELNVKRVGTAHQAGSDSLLTGKIFWEVKKLVFRDQIDDDKYLGQVWGLNGMGGAAAGQAGGNLDAQSTPNINGATLYAASASPSTPHNPPPGSIQSPNQQGGHGNGAGMGSLTPGGVFGKFVR